MPRFSPRASKRSGRRESERLTEVSGVIEIIEASRGASRRTRGRRARRGRPSFCASAAPGASARSRPGLVNSSKISRRCARSSGGRSKLRSSCGRASSISLSYCTPDGQAVTHAMQPRQRSRWVTSGAEISSWPSFIRTMRPRGESISSPQST